jgi:S-DNA-T family DNA segregation ATPase FtsK/SpoIIIE
MSGDHKGRGGDSVPPLLLGLWLLAVGLWAIGHRVLEALSSVVHLIAAWTIPGLVVGAVVLAIVYMVRYARADAEMRRSIRLAWYVRFTWKRLSRMVGLAVIQPASGQVVGRRSSGGSGVSSGRLRVPRIRVRPDAYGVVLSVRTLPRIGREEWAKAADHLANAWGCVRVAVMQERPGRLVVRAVRRDPLAEAYELVPSGRPPATLTRWNIGRDEYAEAVAVRLADVPGISVSGLPGYGKTSLLNNLIAGFAPSDSVQFAVVDGKGGADYEDLRDRFFGWSGDDLKDANELFKRMYELRRVRSEYVRSLLGVKNMWHVGPSRSWPLVVLVIDEAHTFLADIKGDRDLAMLAADNRRLVEDIVKKGRSVGMVTVLATQKSTGDAIPTAIRDVCPVALSFAQRTDEAAVAALGADIRQYPDANPVALQDPAYVGVASMAAQGRPGFVRVRTPYVSDERVARICTETATLTRDPLDLVAGQRRQAA